MTTEEAPSAPIEVVRTRVFPAGPGGGNPCPVVLNAANLSPEQMRAVAQRFGEESGFVVSEPSADVIVLRFFVPEHEMSMCVHATIACVALLHARGRAPGPLVNVETGIGVLAVRRLAEGNAVPRLAVEQRIPEASTVIVNRDDVARVLRIAPETIVGPVESWSASRPKLIVRLAKRSDLSTLNPDWEAMWRLCERYETSGVYAFWADPESGELHARQFPVRAGYNEDAATGVAAAALSGYLISQEPPKLPCTVHREIFQGAEMGRLSLLVTHVAWDGDSITGVTVEGSVVVDGVDIIPG